MNKENGYCTPDVYEVSFVTLKTGIHPKIKSEDKFIEFVFEDTPQIRENVEAFHLGAEVEAKTFGRIIARNFGIIRKYNRGILQ